MARLALCAAPLSCRPARTSTCGNATPRSSPRSARSTASSPSSRTSANPFRGGSSTPFSSSSSADVRGTLPTPFAQSLLTRTPRSRPRAVAANLHLLLPEQAIKGGSRADQGRLLAPAGAGGRGGFGGGAPAAFTSHVPICTTCNLSHSMASDCDGRLAARATGLLSPRMLPQGCRVATSASASTSLERGSPPRQRGPCGRAPIAKIS